MRSFRQFTIPDWISFYRLAAAPFLILMLTLDQREWFSCLLLFSYVSDMVDGLLARKLKVVQPEGSQIDTLGDQVTFLIAVAGVLVFELEFFRSNLLLIVLAFLPYVLQSMLALKKYGKLTAFHTLLAKTSAMVQSAFILWTLFFGPVYWLFYATLLIGVLETVEEITLIFMYRDWTSDVLGIYWALRDERRSENRA